MRCFPWTYEDFPARELLLKVSEYPCSISRDYKLFVLHLLKNTTLFYEGPD